MVANKLKQTEKGIFETNSDVCNSMGVAYIWSR